MFDGQVDSEKRINLVYDDVQHHFHVINNVTGALSRKYFCKGCNKVYGSGVTHRCQETVCQFRHIRTMMSESRASCVIDSLGAVHVLTSTR